MSSVRHAVAADLPRLLVLGKRFFDEAGWPAMLTWDEDSTRRALEVLIKKHVLIVAEEYGEIVGMTGATVSPAYFNMATPMATEMFWYVEPGRRNGIGRKLLARLERCCAEKGATLIVMLAVGHQASALDHLYRRSGYRPCERSFIKRLS